MTRRTFLEASLAGAAGVLTGGLQEIVAAASTHLRLATAGQASSSGETFLLGGDLLLNRLGVGAMRLTGEGIWGLAARSNSCIVSGLRCGWRYAGTNSIFTLRPSDLAARFNVASVTEVFSGSSKR